jgi:uncharacterized repeat protein (TIGR03803 family)
MRGKRFSIGLRAALAIFTVALLVTSTWAATNWKEKVLHNFGNGTDGDYLYGGLISNAAGNLYGTTYQGGTFGHGTVFELTPAAGGGWTEQVLHSFGNGTDGAYLYGGLILDAAGNLYGTTYVGGTYGHGTVFELTPTAGGGWTELVLYSFCSQTNCTDGGFPRDGGLIFDAVGNLYGVTTEDGAYGGGTVFELTPTAGGGWTEQVLHSFSSYPGDGAGPYGSLIFDKNGNLYGTTQGGGTFSNGTVFELTPTAGGGWTETVLHSFNNNGADGFHPADGVIFDTAGNLYGTTLDDGYFGCPRGTYCGTVFELTPKAGGGWTEQVLHRFNGTDGDIPSGLIFDAVGNLYGPTADGGDYGGGTVFELTPTADGGWTETVLHSFGNSGTGAVVPVGDLIFDAAGNLYGTSEGGGTYGGGTVFELTPVYPCARCSHAVSSREVDVPPSERRDMLE